MQHGVHGAANAVGAQRLAEFHPVNHWPCANAHGFMAEHANHHKDTRLGRNCAVVGGDNATSGPDRLVDGVPIQSKYCADPGKTISAVFEGDKLKYTANGRPMQVEVPPEQYHDVVDKLEKRIRDGRVEGITDARHAKRIIRKGHYSYRSAVRMCKAGKVAGLKYDARTGLLGAGLAGSMSFAIGMATGDWQDGKIQQTLKASARQAVVGLGTALGTHVATAQLSRLGATKAMRPLADAAIKKLPATVTRQLATGAGGKALSGAAAASHLSKVARCNALSIGVVGAIDLAKSAKQLADGKISGVQVAHNTARSAAGMAAGSVGWTAGSALGASIGSVVPGLGTAVGYFVGGMCGALSGGKAGSYTAGRMATGTIGPDDNAFVENVSQRVLEALLTKHDLSDIAVHNVQEAMLAVDRRTLLQDRNGAFRVLQKAAVAAL